MGAKCATAKWHDLAKWGSKFAGKLFCVCMFEIIMLIADSPSHFLAGIYDATSGVHIICCSNHTLTQSGSSGIQFCLAKR